MNRTTIEVEVVVGEEEVDVVEEEVRLICTFYLSVRNKIISFSRSIS